MAAARVSAVAPGLRLDHAEVSAVASPPFRVNAVSLCSSFHTPRSGSRIDGCRSQSDRGEHWEEKENEVVVVRLLSLNGEVSDRARSAHSDPLVLC